MAYERLDRFYDWGLKQGLWDSHKSAADFIEISQPLFSAIKRRAKKPGGWSSARITKATEAWGDEPPILNTEWHPELSDVPSVPKGAITHPSPTTEAGAGK